MKGGTSKVRKHSAAATEANSKKAKPKSLAHGRGKLLSSEVTLLSQDETSSARIPHDTHGRNLRFATQVAAH